MWARMAHSPSDEENSTYDGVIWIAYQARFGYDAPPPGGPMAQAPSVQAMSVQYARLGTLETPRVIYDFRQAQITHNFSAAFSGNAKVDFNLATTPPATTDENNAALFNTEGWVRNIWYWMFDINPNTDEAKIALWNNPGSSYFEDARGYIASITKDSEGVLRGCAAVGSTGKAYPTDADGGVSVRRATYDSIIALVPRGVYTSSDPNSYSKGNVTKQCFYQKVFPEWDWASWEPSGTLENVATTVHGVAAPDLSGLESIGVDLNQGLPTIVEPADVEP